MRVVPNLIAAALVSSIGAAHAECVLNGPCRFGTDLSQIPNIPLDGCCADNLGSPFVISSTDLAPVCPANRPNARFIEEWSQTTTLLACIPKLVCAPNSNVCSETTFDCNRPSRMMKQICLSDDDLHAAEARP